MDVVHQPVLTAEVLDFLACETGDWLLLDATVGEGGHSASFLQRFEDIRVVGIDADPVMIERARSRLAPWEGRFELIHQWFDAYVRSVSGVRPDRILADLGISMYHFAGSGRGFSFRDDEPLDMRLDPDETTSAADLVNEVDETRLADIIYQFGEERYSRRIAAAICRRRARRRFTTAADLADTIRGAVPSSYRNGRLHPATRTFQALRIAVNTELDRLRSFIPDALRLLAPGGRLAIISFHSLEDRIVKYAFRDADPDQFRIVTKKPVVATDPERHANPASRSAKLRVIEHIASPSGKT